MKIMGCGFLLLALLSASPSPAQPIDTIGHIHTLTGTVSIIRGTVVLGAAVKTPLQRGDLIRTGKPGSVGIVLTDDTTISLGPNSELALTDYVFSPKEGRFSLVMRMMKGTFSYLSGLMAKLAPDSVKLGIPNATIAVRGTKLLVQVEE